MARRFVIFTVARAAIISALVIHDARGDAVAHADTAGRAAALNALHLEGVHEQGSILGRPSAPVTLAVFSDPQCPPCTPFFLETLPRLLRRWVITGRLRVDYLAFQTATRNRREFLEEETAALAAGAQDKAWLYVERFYEHQGEEDTDYANEQFLDQLAAETPGLNVAAWNQAKTSSVYTREVVADERLANRHHVIGTPEWLLGRTGSALHTLQIESDSVGAVVGQFNRAIARVLNRSRSH